MYVCDIPKDKIKLNPRQHREDLGDIEAFREDIKNRGLLNPITVRIEDGEYILVAGERRLRAYPYDNIPCNVINEDNSSNTVAENLMRRSLYPLEIAKGFNDLIEDGYTVEEIARMVDPSLTSVHHAEEVKGGHKGGRRTKLNTRIKFIKDHLKLLELPEPLEKLVRKFPNQLSMRHISYITQASASEEDKTKLAELAVAEELTTAELRQCIASMQFLTNRSGSLKSYREYISGKDEKEQSDRFKDMFGFIPDSSWYSESKDNAVMKKYIADTYSLFKVEKGRGYEGSYTEFLPDVAYRIIVLWSEEGDIMVDPMAGRGTRGAIAWALKRDVHMFDCDKNFYKQLQKLVEKTEYRKKFLEIENSLSATLCDSRNMPLPNDYADLVFSCPPYWIKEKYSGDGQLTDLSDYNDFLDGLTEIFKDSYRILKPEKFMVMVVSDFRDKGKFYRFHEDTIRCAERAGFILWDIVISKVTTNKQVRLPQALEKKWTIRDHEYVLVFVK